MRRPRCLRSGPGGAAGCPRLPLVGAAPGVSAQHPLPPRRTPGWARPSRGRGSSPPSLAVPGAPRAGRCPRCPELLRRRLPVLRWLPHYSRGWLQLDAGAGLTVALTAVPQALAYAEVAGLPPQYGLYSSFVGCFVYCVLGTAKDVTLGPTAIMSLLVSSYAARQPACAVLLAFLCGCVQLAMGLLHLGFLLDFISCPVVKGFTLAASVTISVSQVKNILGLRGIPGQFVLQVYETLRRIGETRVGDALLGLACLAALGGLQAMKSRLPPAAPGEPLATRISCLIVRTAATARSALVVLCAGLVAYSFEALGSCPLTLTGSIPRGLPAFRPPPFSMAAPNGTVPFLAMVRAMGAGLAVVPLVGLLETIAIARAFASQNGYRVDPNQELLAMGVSNILGSFVSSYPITGSFGRTAVNAQSGVRTPAGGLLTGTLVLLSLSYLTSLFGYVPRAALAAVIIAAVLPMFEPGIFRTLWRVKRLDLVPLCVTFLLCFWEVQYGIAAGLLVSGVLLLYPLARPPIQVSQGAVLLVQPGSSLHFPAVEYLRDAVCSRALAAASPPRSVVLDCCHVSSIDSTVVLGLAELRQELRRQGLPLAFCRLQDPVLRVLLSAGFEGFQQFPSREEAERWDGAEPEGSGAAPSFASASQSSLLPTGLIQ